MKYVLIIVARGIVDDVVFFDDPTSAVKTLATYVKHMDADNHDAAVYGPEGFIANAKHFLDGQERYIENDTLIENVTNGFPKPIYLIGNPEHRLGFMVASPDDPLGYGNPVEALSDLGQMRKDHGKHLALYRVVPVNKPIAVRGELDKYIDDCEVEDFDYKLVEEYLV